MRTLNRKAPAWVRVAGSEAGGDLVEFLMTPASALQYDMALERAMAAARQLRDSEEVRAAYGLAELPVEVMIEEAETTLGISTTLLAVELALTVATGWRGYLGEDGETPAAFTRRNIALAMQDWHGGVSLARRFTDIVLAPIFEVAREGKPSAAAPPISGAAASSSATDAAS